MPYALGLDIGKRRTGIAFGESNSQVVVALDSIVHSRTDELIEALKPIIVQRKIEHIYAGLPLLPTGEEGAQSKSTREVARRIERECQVPVTYVDERYTNQMHGSQPKGTDDNARAACQILQMAFERKRQV